MLHNLGDMDIKLIWTHQTLLFVRLTNRILVGIYLKYESKRIFDNR